jgi:hypothetical protein
MMGSIMRDWMFSPANPGNMYYSRRGQRGGGGRGRRRGGGGGGGSAQDEATVNNTGNWNINFEGPKFGDQTNLGRGDFGGMMPGGQGQQSTQSGTAPAQGQPPARNRPQLTPAQKQRNAETARARRSLTSDIKKQGTPEQQKRIEEQGVAGGKVRQPRQPKTTSQQTTGSTFSNVSANSIQANQVSAGSMNVGAGATGGPQAAGAPFIDLGSVSGGSASSPSSGAKAQGGTIGGVKIN